MLTGLTLDHHKIKHHNLDFLKVIIHGVEDQKGYNEIDANSISNYE